MFLTISGRVLCLLDLLVARLEQPPGLEKIVLQSREFFPEEKRILHLPRFQKPVLETDLMKRSEAVSEDSLITLA